MHNDDTVKIPLQPTEKCLNEIRAALVQTGAMGLRHSCEKIYQAVINHGVIK